MANHSPISSAENGEKREGRAQHLDTPMITTAITSTVEKDDKQNEGRWDKWQPKQKTNCPLFI